MVRVSPRINVSPPLGAVRARAPRVLKFAGDVEVTAVSLLRVILTLTVVEIASGTGQAKLPPAAGVERVMAWISARKLSREYSSFRSASAPAMFQGRFWPALIVKAAVESSETVVSAVLVTRTLTLVEAMSGTVHAYVPAAAAVEDVIRLG